MKSIQLLLYFLLAGVILSSCKQNNKNTDMAESDQKQDSVYVVDLKAVDYAFAMPAEIPSGWITFRMENMGKEEHVAVVVKVADTLNLEDARKILSEATAAGFPDGWGAGLISGSASGVGMLSAGRIGETTVYLEPGVYMLTCGVKTPNNISHSMKGMNMVFEAVGSPVQREKPETDIKITLSNYAISTDQPIGAGTHKFDVRVPEESIFDLFVARLDQGQKVEDVVDWMEDLRAPSPFDFIGGTEQKSGIFKVTLEPGRYALLSHQGAYAGLAEELVIPVNGQAPPITHEPVNPPILVTLPGEESVVKGSPGRTPVIFENTIDSQLIYGLFLLKPSFTKTQFYDFLQPANLGSRWEKSDPDSIPFFFVTDVRLDPNERKEALSIDFREGIYFLYQLSVAHWNGDHALTQNEIESIKKIEVR